jgi:hypothetical protein
MITCIPGARAQAPARAPATQIPSLPHLRLRFRAKVPPFQVVEHSQLSTIVRSDWALALAECGPLVSKQGLGTVCQ